ncbi:hypothetical protein AM493_13545 [Flavobacterium akiainvivens]|uniref:Uncharacterized protein n=1 Tax=Flavobacterium akiainvivens TaxID=1202724 RepID=A0A0M8MIJ1_9FLAO|nr:hypothetical protein [Flavobacterium akiainvivens]KOS06941.1 hypothetical protein AM493_13545 [Flavobacterium akiainvivens]SFQ60263.1 hypothetical protein SAMN05444144_109171 [Flavobacterium akiainvivens]
MRGYEYGHYPGMYKYRWNGFKIDTVEYVYADTVVRNKYYITSRSANNLPPEKESGIKRIIYKLPAEYKNIDFDYASHIISSHEKSGK